MRRRPAVAGMFYESSVEALRRQLEKCFASVPREEIEMKGAVVPHAGYIYLSLIHISEPTRPY